MWFLSGDDGSDRIYLDTVITGQEDTIVVGHGFLELLTFVDSIWFDSTNIYTADTFHFPVCNSDETADTLYITGVTLSHPETYTILHYPTVLAPGECDDIVVEFHPNDTGSVYDTLVINKLIPCDSVSYVPVIGRGIRPRIDSVWFSEETDCDGQNVVEVCYNLYGEAGVPNSVQAFFTHESLGGEWFNFAEFTVEDTAGDFGDSIYPGVHCFNWLMSEDLPNMEIGDFQVAVQLSEDIRFTTAEDFSRGEFSHISLLTPDPDGIDDGALWIPPERDTIYVLQVYPDGHCTDCMSSAIYEYMRDGTPPLNLKIYLISISQFNASATSPASTLSVSYIDETGTIHSPEDMVFSNFDVVMFGVADCYGGNDLTPTSAEAVREFVLNGGGLLLTHDTFINHSGCAGRGFHTNFLSLSDITGLTAVDASIGSAGGIFTTVHRVYEGDISVLHLPFNIPDTFSTLATHALGQRLAAGDILYSGNTSVSDSICLYWQVYPLL